MKNQDKIISYVLLGLVLIAMVFSIGTFFSKGYSQEKYEKFVSAEGDDKCKTPSGYTDKEWKDHMSHHPEQYKECLN